MGCVRSISIGVVSNHRVRATATIAYCGTDMIVKASIHSYLGTQHSLEMGSGQKQVYLVRLGPKTGTYYNQVKSAPYQPCRSKAHCTCFWRIKLRYTRVCLLSIDFQLFFFVFSQSEALHSSTLCPPYGCRRTGGPPPPSTPRTTPYEQHAYLPTHFRRATYIRYADTNLHHGHMATDGCASAASEMEVGSIYPTCITCCWCGVVWDAEGGGGLYVRRHSYYRRRHTIGWNCGGSLIG